jgi:diguanylate cyclase (GGDEF)-like protein
MGDGLRTFSVVTTDEALLANARAATSTLEGWEVAQAGSVAEILEHMPPAGDVILLDAWTRSGNVYEECKRLAGQTRCRTFVVSSHGNRFAESIARFCGATGVLERPVTASRLRAALDHSPGMRPALSRDARGQGNEDAVLPEKLLADIAGQPDESLVSALVDPETSLFNYAFLNYKLDEEFKRARRFESALSCVMLGFEGQLAPNALQELASIFLELSRDTDVLGRFDECSFLFLLPHTGPDGAKVMAKRIGEQATERSIVDLVGDPVVISVGISTSPHPDVRRKDDLFSQARRAFLDAQKKGGGVVCTT